MNKFFQLIAILTLSTAVIFQTGCTSGDEKSDVESVEEGQSDGLVEEAAAATDTTATSDELPEDALGNESAPTTAAHDEPSLDSSASESLDTTMSDTPAPEIAATDTAAPVDTPVDTPTEAVSEPSTDTATASAEPQSEEPVKKSIPLQKIAEKPWKVGGKWINTVYFARPDESLAQISQKIYGEDRTRELKNANPTYKARGVKPGDKVYFQSSKRPEDSEKVLTYYEDMGVSPETYTAKSGDNIRTISKELLGYPEAWKEVWASNTVESKGEIAEGTSLRYWKSVPDAGTHIAAAPTETPPTANAENPPPPPATPHESAPEQNVASSDFPPPPSMDEGAAPPPPPPASDMAANDLPPPPPPVADGAASSDFPPPPSMDEGAAPPPPPAMAGTNEASHEKPSDKGAAASGGMALDDESMMTLGIGAFAALALVGLIVVRKKRKQKELEAGIHMG